MSAPITDLGLEAQIARAELAVIERDARIRRRADALAIRVKREAVKHAGGGVAVGLGTLALAWWLKRRHPAAPPAPEPAPAPEHSEAEHLARDAAFTLAGLLPVIWPMLPRSLRRSLTPGTASNLITFIMPLLAKLFRRKPRPAAP